MKNKRGQLITYYIIIGITLLLAFGFLLYTKDVSTKGKLALPTEMSSKIPIETEPIKSYVESCLKKVTEDGAWLVGYNGGYIDANGLSKYGEKGAREFYNGRGDRITYSHDYSVPYYLDRDYPVSYPPRKKVEEKLSRYILVELENCLNFTSFQEIGFDITKPIIDYEAINFDLSKTDVNCTVSLNKEDIGVLLKYPLIIKKSDFTTDLDSFRTSAPIRLGSLYDAAVTLADNIYASQPYYNIEPYCSLYDTNGLTNVYYKYNDNGAKEIIRFIDYETYEKKYTKSYVFQFGIKNVGFVGSCIG